MNDNVNKNDMAQIPYIVHKKRMYEAYQREKVLKVVLVLTNAFWIVVSVWRWLYV